MSHRTWLIAAITILAAGLANAAVAPQAQKEGSPKKQQAKKQAGASLTGCLDQQEGLYVLVDDRDLKKIAGLEADGFPTEGFAKHMGQKVTVRGTSSPGSTGVVFKVRSIETVNAICAPETTQQGKK